jgi:hypothetical protein
VRSGSFSIRALGPDGKCLGSMSSSQVQTSGTHCQDFLDTTGILPGAWVVTFNGTGTGTGIVDLTKA